MSQAKELGTKIIPPLVTKTCCQGSHIALKYIYETQQNWNITHEISTHDLHVSNIN